MKNLSFNPLRDSGCYYVEHILIQRNCIFSTGGIHGFHMILRINGDFFLIQLWEPPTVQNGQPLQCSESRRYLYTILCSLALCATTQELPNQRS
jgi:hypothetical protein